MSNTKKKKKKNADEIARKAFKKSSGFMWGLLVNVIIVFLAVKVFSGAFNFAYGVFGDVALDPSEKDYKLIEIPADSSIMEIGAALEENNIIDSKYVFYGKVKVKGYGDKIVANKYGLSASMTYGEILDTICCIDEEDEEGDE
ncbi:MAG: hypothetical protein ACI39Q_08145 [Wujia sp.]